MVEKRKKKVKSKGTQEKNIEFTYDAPKAIEVCLAGEFNAWDIRSLPLKKDKSGVWKTKIRLLPGRYEYKLFADNAWVEDLPGAEVIPNRFGTKNFVVWVG